MISEIHQLDVSKQYTYADYLSWQFDEMIELIRGKIFLMSPAPGLSHQRISSNLHRIIANHFFQQKCQVFHAPFDVRLPLAATQEAYDQVDTVVQPDICVVCDEAKLDEKGCAGAPDWIIEIISPSTASKDLTEKFELYQSSGVKEYWIVYPEGSVYAYALDEKGKYELYPNRPLVKEDMLRPISFPSLIMKLEEVFI
ncbi:MAG: Uma2 family endonuclease [Bacteroidota bacterium]